MGVRIKTKNREKVLYWESYDNLLQKYRKGDIIKIGFVNGKMVYQVFIPKTKKSLEDYKTNYKKIFNKEVDKNILYDTRELPDRQWRFGR